MLYFLNVRIKILYIYNNNKFENMLKQKYILFVYFIISSEYQKFIYKHNMHLCLLFFSKLLFKTKQNTLTNTHTHADKKSVLD